MDLFIVTALVIAGLGLGVLTGLSVRRKAHLLIADPRPLEVWSVFGIGEVLVEEVDTVRGVVLVVPETGDETKVWLSLEQVRLRGSPVHQKRQHSGRLDRVARMRGRD